MVPEAGEILEAVVLAAGLSSRAGAFKPALDCGGAPMVVQVVRAFALTCRRIWVVTGHRGDEVADLVATEPGGVVVPNPLWETGMFSSVRAGVARVTTARFFLTPGDLPEVTSGTVEALARVSGSLVVPVYQGRSGHPILLGKEWIRTILAAPPGGSLRTVLSGTPRTEVEVGEEVLRDIDTCEDYEDYLRRMK